MKRTPFNDGWQFREKVNPFAELGGVSAPYEDITLPHDALIRRPRDPHGEAATAYFPGGAFQYRTTIEPTDDMLAGQVMLEFEGVYRDAVVTVNGEFAGQRPYGYSVFTVDIGPLLTPGRPNEILVEARAHKDSRWYTGAGIHRPVWLLTGRDVHIEPTGLRITTPDIDDHGAVVEVDTVVSNTDKRRRTVDVRATVTGPEGTTVAEGSTRVTIPAGESVLARQRLYLKSPFLWSADSPTLYAVEATVSDDLGAELDQAEATFGIRRLQVDPVNGLRVNGRSVKLRGACVHHDNGILGSAAFAPAEERRVRLLKEAGFNAIRASHNPLSTAMIEACDRLGMYVMDETFDVWTSAKTEFDYSLDFADWWERDVESLVHRDFNHPSVIMYSIGNEIPETGSAAGGLIGRRLAEKVRSLDATRFVTNAVNGMLAVLGDLKQMAAGNASGPDEAGINTLMAGAGEAMNAIGSSQLVTERTAESFGVLDVAGMNYLDGRYVMDRELFPNRVIVGTETFPTRIDHNWALVSDNAHVIGDFTWTGWDYLGEVGIGRPRYRVEGETPSISSPYPWIAAWCGDIDLIGNRRPASFYRETVFGLRDEPYIAVIRPGGEAAGAPLSPWAWSDSIASWTWPVDDGTVLSVEVYSDADEVELFLNGVSLGRRASGPASRFTAVFDVPYQRGQLVAVAIRDGAPAEEFAMRTASDGVFIRAVSERTEVGASDLIFLPIDLVDAHGTIVSDAVRDVTVTIDGPAVLAAIGSADPAPTELYGGPGYSTFDGRALAVIRTIGAGPVRVLVSSDGVETVIAEITAGAAG